MKQPNFNNARTRKTLKSALGMTLGCLSADKPRQLGTRFISKYYGDAKSDTSKWLRKTLLHATDENYNKDTGKCKTYVYKPAGVALVKDILNLNITPDPVEETKITLEWMQNKFCNVENITYKDKSNRLWCDQQNVRRQQRNVWLREQGLTHQYDIQTAAPTLLHQRSWQYSHGHILETIDFYINNKNSVRSKLAQDTGLDYDVIKHLLNSLFAGACISENPQTAIFDLVNKDIAIIRYLKQDPFIVALVADIRQMWEYLKPEIPFRQARLHGELRYKKDGTPWKAPINSKDKWHLYFSLERKILNSIKNYLEYQGLPYFLIHDAFASTELPYGVSDLEMWISSDTGFVVQFDTELLSGLGDI